MIVLGRQPALGLAELESLYGSQNLEPAGYAAALVNLSAKDIDFKRLGGSVKLAKLLDTINSVNWSDIEKYLIEHIPKHVCCISDGKLVLGLSVYGLNVNPKDINKTGLTLKKMVVKDGRPCRIVPNKSPSLSSAQVLHNKLFTSHNWELILVRHKNKVYLTQTAAVQDIEAYSARDFNRPKRDARVGMLPPKLAQIIINLVKPQPGSTMLDPFCGTGVMLQEALLMGFKVVGSDIDPRMIDYSKANLKWLLDKWNLEGADWQLAEGDACSQKWPQFDFVACETYLGRPFSAQPSSEVLSMVIQDADTIHTKFLINLASQTKSGFRFCLGVPAWKTKNGFLRLPTLEKLEKLGYNRAVFKHISNRDLIYHRENQIVGRELLVLVRK